MKNTTKERKFQTFTVMLNPEERVVLRRLRCDYGINISRTVKIILKEKLKQLDAGISDFNLHI